MLQAVQAPLRALRENTLLGPAAILFVSANVANVANLIFNMLFARLMGPAAFADLTLLLTLKLGLLSFLGALQFAVSEQSAKSQDITASKTQAKTFSVWSLKVSIPLMFSFIACSNYISAALNFSSPLALCLLALALPFFLPMIIYRGLTQGLIDVPKIVFSIQAEWIIRLFGSLLLWKMGFGLPGIAVAVGMSIAAGFIFSTDKTDLAAPSSIKSAQSQAHIKALGNTALPYLILQMAQVLVLDSDIIIAKAVFTPQTAGLVAGLLLIQRVFFFAFLSCSMILQPLVAKQAHSKIKVTDKTPKELLTLLGAIAIITLGALIVIIPNSDLIVRIMLGSEYLDLSAIVWISALTGAVFICSHLCAIHQIAQGRKFAAKVVFGFGIFQLISLVSVNHLFPAMGLYTYFSIKLAIQILCAVCLIGIIMNPSIRSRRAR